MKMLNDMDGLGVDVVIFFRVNIGDTYIRSSLRDRYFLGKD